MTQIGNELPNVLIGSGIDTLFGLGEGDSLTGSQDGKGLMNGNAGDDTLRSRSPEDTMYGGQGDDVLISSGGSLMFGDLGDDTLVGEGVVSVFGGGQGGSDTMNGGSGADSLVAAAGGNTLMFGNQGNDTLEAKSSTDTLFGGADDDCLLVGSFALLAYGDLGSDKIESSGSAGGATLFGGSSDFAKNDDDGNDTITSGGNNLIFGNGGDDVLNGSIGDTIRGGQDNDTITAAAEAQVFGDLGDDVITVGENSTVSGGAGSDTLTATGSGNMLMDGGSEANTFVLGTGAIGNTVMLGSGDGRQLVNAAGSGNTINGGASNGNNTINSSGGNLILLGSGQETVNANPTDTVVGAVSGVDLILGGPVLGSASGFIIGDAGSNVLQGDSGVNTLEGLGGSDTLTGGSGQDTFLFRGTSLALVGIPTFNGSTINGTAQFVTYTYGGTGGTASTNVVTGQTFLPGTTAGASLPTFVGTGAINGGTAAPFVGGTFGYTNAQFLFSTGGPVEFIQGGTITSTTRFEFAEGQRPVVDETVTINTGGTVLAPESAFSRNVSNSAGTFAGAGYGYATSGFDVITDFETGTDKIAIQISLLGLPNSPTLGTAPVAVSAGGTSANDLVYDATTGILYFNRGKAAGLVSVPTFSAEPLFKDAVAAFGGTALGTQVGTGAPMGTTGAFATGTAGFAPFTTAAADTSGTTNTAFLQTQYTFGTAGATLAVLPGAGANAGIDPTASASAVPIPFLQVLTTSNGMMAPLSNLPVGDVIFF